MPKKFSFGLMDIPMSCSLFMEPALTRHKHCIAPVSVTAREYIREWNRALIEVMKQPCMQHYLGEVGQKILNGTMRNARYAAYCTEHAETVPMHSLHYALRFTESAKFLSDKIASHTTNSFVDLGAGFSPLAAAIQTEYNISNAYIIDMPEIMDAYIRTAEMVGGRVPRTATWEDAKNMATSHRLDTIVAMGVMQYMPLDEQVERMKFINSHIPNFLLEIKYNNHSDAIGGNTFDLKKLQSLRLLVSDTQTLETTLIKNSLRYLSSFIRAMPNKKNFLENDRSLFLSR